MNRMPIWVFSVLISLLLATANAEQEDVKIALVQFMGKLSPGSAQRDQNWGWNSSSDPCADKWAGVECDKRLKTVRRIVLEESSFSGTLDAESLCKANSLLVLSLNNNGITGELPEQISNCKQLTHLYLSGNRFSGHLPESISMLSNLKRLFISNNNFSGDLPDLPRISGLLSFLAENNQLTGTIPNFDFFNLRDFNVSNNNFSGSVPDVKGRFDESSFTGNAELCGNPLSVACPPTPPAGNESKGSSKNQALVYSGYIILGLVVVLFVAFILVKRNKKPKIANTDIMKEEAAMDTTTSSNNKPSSTSSDYKNGGNRSEYSITSVESGMASSSLVVLTSPVVNELKFEDLLRAPAELLGRGKNGSLYKVTVGGVDLAVKRIKEWSISSSDFKRRMLSLDQVKHLNVLPAVAFYCSKQEKLLVYEYFPNGSLFNLLHGSKNGQIFDWGSRLSVAATIAEALAFMHEELQEEKIAHGNLKSTNILLNQNMEPCISEYGLMAIDNQNDQSFIARTEKFQTNNDLKGDRGYSNFKADIFSFGVILLELLTGKLVQKNGFDLAKWVHSVVREEWTVEVFDRDLISEGASEERMVNLLRVALKCINSSPNERPSMNQVAVMINTNKEEEERSISSDP